MLRGPLTQVHSRSPARLKSISLQFICLFRRSHFISRSGTEAAVPPDGLEIETCSKGICPFRAGLLSGARAGGDSNLAASHVLFLFLVENAKTKSIFEKMAEVIR